MTNLFISFLGGFSALCLETIAFRLTYGLLLVLVCVVIIRMVVEKRD